MKKIKVSILALSVLVGGAVLASAAKDSNIIGATSDVYLTNAVPLVWYDVNTAPTSGLLTNLSAGPGSVIDTDSSGKISGVANIIKSYTGTTGTNTNSTVIAISSWYTTIKGKISASKMAQANVSMSIKGDGYAAPDTNLVLVIPSQKIDAFPGKLSVNFSAKNVTAVSNNAAYHILGNLKGSVTPAVKGAKTEKIDQVADLVVNRRAMDEIDMRVVVSGSKLAAIAFNGEIYGATGTANIGKGGTYTLNLKDPAGGASSLQLKGTTAVLVQPGNTNNTVTTVSTADVKGKLQGQAVEGTAFKTSNF
jgi:hypothetical protein